MAAKARFDIGAITAGLPDRPTDDPATERPVARSPGVPIARAVEAQSRNAIQQLRDLELKIERRKLDGLEIEEIDPALVVVSRFWRRDERFLQDKSFADFVEDIRKHEQQSPSLLRPHPEQPGHYEVCFGHRRLYAARHLGKPLRAVIRELSDAQLAGAAYGENARREGISVMEEARELALLVQAEIFPDKQSLGDALGKSRSHVSNMVKFATIPDAILNALGDWRQITFRDAMKLWKAASDPGTLETMLATAERILSTDARSGYAARLTLLLGGTPADAAETDDIRDHAGHLVVRKKRGKRSTGFAFDPDANPALVDFVWERLPALFEEFEKARSKKR